MKKQWIAGLLAMLCSSVALAQATPAGLWKTIDDDSKQEKSLVRIVESGGVYTGTIEKVLDPATKPDAVCDKCPGDRKDKPIVGLVIVRNVKQNASDPTIFDSGDITDPNNGKVYRVRLRPVEGGKQLEVRGFIGPFYRTQFWHRVE